MLCGQPSALETLRGFAFKEKNPIAQAFLSLLLRPWYGMDSYERVCVFSDKVQAKALEAASVPWLRKNANNCQGASIFLGMLLIRDIRYRYEGEKILTDAGHNGCVVAQLHMAAK